MTFPSQLRWLCALALLPSLCAAAPPWTMDVALGSQVAQPSPTAAGGPGSSAGAIGATLQLEAGAPVGRGWSLLGVATAAWYPAQSTNTGPCCDLLTVTLQDAFRAGGALRYTSTSGALMWFGQVSPQAQLDLLKTNSTFSKWGFAGAASTGLSWRLSEGWSAGLRADAFVGTIDAGMGLSLFIAWGAG